MSNSKKELNAEDIEKMLDSVVKFLRTKKLSKARSGLLLSEDEKKVVVSTPLPKKVREKLGLLVPVTVFAQDPKVAIENPMLGLEEIKVNWEPGLADGPTSARIAVVDYDADTSLLEKAAKWDPKEWSFVGDDDKKLDGKNKDNFQFHQVNVWGVVLTVLEFYQDSTALGRPIPWGFNGNRLIVVPHAGYGENAIYDRKSKSLQLFYCGTKEKRVYTCLSHDIIAHETGHAILDGIRPLYNESLSLQARAFHEFIADLTAILSAMCDNAARREIAEETGGDLEKAQALGNLAEEFAKQVTGEDYVRSAFNDIKMDDVTEGRSPHFCSQVLTGAMFDITIRIAENYMVREYKTKNRNTAYQALWFTIDRLRRIALQPLDYCPPVDIRFEDYVDALLARDQLTNPSDLHQFRKIMREAFTNRGIKCSEEDKEPDYSKYYCPNIEYFLTSRTAAYLFLNEKRELLCIPKEQDIVVADLYSAHKMGGAYHRLPQEIVLQYTWKESVKLEGDRFKNLKGETVPLLCGGTLVYDQQGNLLYACRKPGTRFKTAINSKQARKKANDEWKAGQIRREQLQDTIADYVKQGVTVLTDEEETKTPNFRTPFAGIRVDGMLRLESTMLQQRFYEKRDKKGGENE